MKIGILTHPLTDNYGGILQAVALYGFLESKGHDVTILRRHRNRSTWRNAVIFLLERAPFQNIRMYKYFAKKAKKQKKFIDENLPNKTRIVHTTSELKKVTKRLKLDAVIVGSDQVWRMSSVDDGHFGNYFLDFISDIRIKKISYAASFGKDVWEAPEKTEQVKKLLSKFHAVSVRECSGIDICNDFLGVENCYCVLDPTLLVKKSFYDSFLIPTKRTTKPEMFLYILDASSKNQEIISTACKLMGNIHRIKNALDIKQDILTVPQWISAIKNADYVITDSFHGTIFCIIFHKQFISIGNKKRGLARFLSLTKSLGLENRVIESPDQVEKVINCKIDYTNVESKISQLREHSENFLIKALSDK